MKAKKILKFGIGLILIVCIGLVSFKSFAHKVKSTNQDLSLNQSAAQDTISNTGSRDANVTVTLKSNTTDDQIDDIVAMLEDNHIIPSLTNLKRNDEGELTSIKIELKDEIGSITSSKTSSNQPIADIVFGRKDGQLYITQRGNNLFSFFDKYDKSMMSAMESDSLLNAFGMSNFNHFFNDDDSDDSFFINGETMTFNQLKEQMMKQFGNTFKKEGSWFNHQKNFGNSDTFSFIDDPDTNKLIVIDGKVSDFEHLNNLAKNNKIKAVDELKPETAISIYGNKAQEGAIIATTKG